VQSVTKVKEVRYPEDSLNRQFVTGQFKE